jgi:hypothetical protein
MKRKGLDLKTSYNCHFLKTAQCASKKLLMDTLEFHQYNKISQFQQICQVDNFLKKFMLQGSVFLMVHIADSVITCIRTVLLIMLENNKYSFTEHCRSDNMIITSSLTTMEVLHSYFLKMCSSQFKCVSAL